MGLLDPFFGPEVAGIEVAVTLHASDRVYAVSAFFERPEDMNDIHFSGARHSDDFYIRRIRQPHRTCQVRSRVPSEIAAERDDDRFKFLAHNVSSVILFASHVGRV